MNNAKCSDVNRECVFGDVLIRENVYPKTRRVVTGRIGYDDISHEEPTGEYEKRTVKYKVCKYCGREVVISSNTKKNSSSVLCLRSTVLFLQGC